MTIGPATRLGMAAMMQGKQPDAAVTLLVFYALARFGDRSRHEALRAAIDALADLLGAEPTVPNLLALIDRLDPSEGPDDEELA